MRDRAALFWTLAFPLSSSSCSGSIFQGGGGVELTLGWVDEDGSPASAAAADALRGAATGVDARRHDPRPTRSRRCRIGKVDAVIVVPDGLRRRRRRGDAGPATPAARSSGLHRPVAASSSQGSVYQAVGSVLGVVNLGGRPPLVVPQPETIQTENLNFISYFVPSMLGLSVMQVGIFAAIPLVADREKLILKRLAATPLRRWQLVGSNVLMRLLIALAQTVIIVGVGVALLRRRDHRQPAR